MKKVLPIIILLFSAINIYSQYKGGVGDGHSSDITTNISKIVINAGSDVTICGADTVTIGTPAGANKTYSWTRLGSPTILANTAIYKFYASTLGIHKYILKVDSMFCSVYDTVIVRVDSPMSQLSVSTGYIANTSTTIPYTPTPLRDNCWKVIQTPNIPNFRLPTDIVPYPSYVVLGSPSYNSASVSDSRLADGNYISPNPSANAGMNLTPELPVVFQRSFSISNNGNLRIIGELLADNYAELYLDNILIKAQSAAQYTTNFLNPMPIDTILSINAGVHNLKINLRNSSNTDPLGVRFSGLLTSCNTNILDDNCYAAPPTVSAGPDQVICMGDSVLIGTPGDVGTSYSWAILNGATFSTGHSQIKVAPATTTTYVLTGTNSGGTQSDNVTVTVNPKPDATISGIANVCTDAVYYYSVPNVPGNVYEWSVSGGVIQAGINNRYEVRIHWGSVGQGSLSVKVTNQYPCVSETTLSITINPPPTAAISYPNPLCAEVRTVNVTQTGQSGGFYSATPYDLFIDMNTGAISITNTTIGTYTITYEVENGICSNLVTTQIIINSIPASPVISATNTCAGGIGQGTISTSTSTSGVSYQLFNNSDNSTIGMPLSGNGEALIWDALSVGTYYVIATDLGTNCNSSKSNNAIISNYPSPIATLSSDDADNTICNEETITFTAGGGVNYEFFINAVSQGTPSTTNTLTINNPINGQVIKAKVYDSNGCTAESSEIIITVAPAPQAIATPTTQEICNGATTAITLSSVGNPTGITYSWTASKISGTVNGYSSGSGTTIAQILTNTGSIPAIVRYAVVSKIGVCLGDTTFVNIVVNPKPNAIATPTAQTICSGGSTSITISTTGTPSGISYSWTAKNISGNVSGFAAGNGSTISQVLTNTGITQAIVRYAIVPKVGTCLGDTIFADVTINPKPSAIATPTAQTICSGEATAINLSTNVSGLTVNYSWTAKVVSGNVSGFANANGSNISQTLTNTGNTSAIVRYAIVAKLGTCSGDTTFVEITINPKPNAIATPQSQTINNGGKTNIAINSGVADPSLTFSWTAQILSGNVSGFANANGNIIAQTLTNSGTTSAIVRYAIVPKLGTCYGDTVYVDITINPTADVIIQQNTDAICNGGTTDIRLSTNSTSTNVSYSWVASIVSGAESGQLNGSGSIIAQTLTHIGLTPSIIRYTITPTIDGLSGRAAIANVTVYPTPIFTISPTSQTINSGETSNIILSTEISGTDLSYEWTAKQISGTANGFEDGNGSGSIISQKLINIGSIPAIVQYTITPRIANCLGTPKIINVTINPIFNAIATPTTQTICSGEITSIKLSSNINETGIIYTWVATKISGSIEGYSNGTGDKITQALTNTGTTPAKVSYEITPKLGELTGTPIKVEIIVLPPATVSVSPTSQTISSGNECNIALSSAVSGIEVLYEWTSNCPSINVSGYSNGSGNKIIQILTNSGNKPETVQYTITPKVGNCLGTSKTVDVTINPKADVNVWQESDAICNGGTTNIKLSTKVSGATVTFSWTAMAQSNEVSGYSNGSGESINHTLVNTGTTPQTVRYTIAPTIDGVIGNAVVADVTVYPTPKVVFTPKSQTIANGHKCDILLTSNVSDANVSFVWEAESISGSVVGHSDSTGNTIAQTLTNLGNTPTIVRYRIIPNIEGCLGVPDSVDITVNPQPKVNIQNLSDTICHDGITNIKLSTPISGVEVSYSWTASSISDKISGYTDGTGDVISDALINTDNAPGKVIYAITPVIDGVSGTVVSTEVVVYPKPTAIATPKEQRIATGQECTINISTGIKDADVLYSWKATCISGDASGYSDGSGKSIIQQLTNSGTTAAIVRYTITPFIGACIGDPIKVNVSIDPEIQPAKYHVALDTVKVQLESKTKLNLKLLSSENLISDGTAKQFKARISFNSSMMKPLFDYSIPEWQSCTKSYRTVEFNGSTDKSNGLLAELPFETNLGNDTVSNVIIESVVWSDVQGEVIAKLDNGRVEFLGICYENGTRLFEPSDPVLINKVSPNPAHDRIEIEFTLIENDKTELIIMNMLGEVVKTIPIASNSLGTKSVSISLDNLSQGQYMIILKTPTIRDERLIKIVR